MKKINKVALGERSHAEMERSGFDATLERLWLAEEGWKDKEGKFDLHLFEQAPSLYDDVAAAAFDLVHDDSGLAKYLNGPERESLFRIASPLGFADKEDLDGTAFARLPVNEGDKWQGWVVEWDCGGVPYYYSLFALARLLMANESSYSVAHPHCGGEPMPVLVATRIRYLSSGNWVQRRLDQFPFEEKEGDEEIDEERERAIAKRARDQIHPYILYAPSLDPKEEVKYFEKRRPLGFFFHFKE